ncbi:uncharacterized protein LOC118206837 [Anguilla anguilla]|uniref:uncharacterized protein LOC118206837 n=1 Tax=Anguilla anguilla TaxID=7936 RepID=UPI0015AAE223|nr:uncharacterized protein LOC118206837 [Anguilla anguilla]
MNLRKLLILLLFFVTVSSSPPSSPPTVPSVPEKKKAGCIKVNNCKCIMSDGSGVINLAALGDSDGYLERFKPILSEKVPASTEILLSFSPCLPFSEPEDFTGTDCLDVAACLIVRHRKNNRFVSRYINYGRHEGNEFQYNDSTKTLSVAYPVLSTSHPQTIVHYHCSPNRSITFSHHFGRGVPLQIQVDSPCACPNACALEDVGPGTIFLIILCLSMTAYLILGSCALRPFRTSSGVQIAPEESLWCMLCYLFTERKGKRPRRKCYSLKEETL